MHDRPLVTVFTPSHMPRYLDECLDSLLNQSYENWEWVVLTNNQARWRPAVHDDRVRIMVDDDINGVGATKRRCCELAQGDILVEFDHDDTLLPHALELIVKTAKDNPAASMYYSDAAMILEDGTPDPSTWSARHGWAYRESELNGQKYVVPLSFSPTPHNACYIWFAPNHVRAFPRWAYEKVGGYNAELTVLDDHDLMSRLYMVGDFIHLGECVYLQRMHRSNTQMVPELNEQIQSGTVQLYDKYFESCALAWAKRNDLLCLDFGAAHNKPEGYAGVDQYEGPCVDYVAELPKPMDLPDNSVGVIRAVDFMEHVTDKVGLINEFYRLLAPGGILLSLTPSTDGRGAFQDPTHVAFYNENSFWYYTQEQYRAFVPQIKARFQVSRLATAFLTDWHRENHIPYVVANLIALKPGTPRNGGFINFPEYDQPHEGPGFLLYPKEPQAE